MLSKYEKISLHPSFSIKDCTFSSRNQGVIYSPVSGKTILCELFVIDFLNSIEVEPKKACPELLKIYPEGATDVIESLARIDVVEF